MARCMRSIRYFLGGLIMCDPQITIALCKFFDEHFVFVISVFFGRDLKKIVKSKQMHVFMST